VLDEQRFVRTEAAHESARWLRDRYADRQIDIVDTGQYDRETVRDALRVDGEFLVGPSSGASAALVADLVDDGRLDRDDTVGLLLCDRGDRYATSLWADVLGCDQ
jgi:cysteine synthase B